MVHAFTDAEIDAYAAIIAAPEPMTIWQRLGLRPRLALRRAHRLTVEGKLQPERIWHRYARGYLTRVKWLHWNETHRLQTGQIARRALTGYEQRCARLVESQLLARNQKETRR